MTTNTNNRRGPIFPRISHLQSTEEKSKTLCFFLPKEPSFKLPITAEVFTLIRFKSVKPDN